MKVKLTGVRLSFPDLFTAVQYKGAGPFNYRAQFLVEADSKADKDIKAAIAEVAKAKWAGKADANLKGLVGNSQKYCYIDGDTKAYDGYAGMMALSATRQEEKGAPLVLDNDKSVLAKGSSRIYAGCKVNAGIEFWVQDNDFGKAIRCTILGVQFAGHDTAFGSGNSVASPDEFDDISVEEDNTADFI